MRWEIRGADASTGEDRLLVIEGLSTEEVEAKARYSGMLVSSITPVAAAPVVAYALPEQQKSTPASARPAIATPLYSSIRRGAWVLALLGAVLILLGMIVTAMSLWAMLTEAKEIIDFAPAVHGWVVQLIFGLCILSAGVLLRLLAAVGLAVRDIARNSVQSP